MAIGGEWVQPGRSRQVELPVALLPTQTQLSLPVRVVHGRRVGPRLWLSAAIHGDEILGVEIIRRVSEKISARQLAGTVVAAPIVNVFGFIDDNRYLPDRRDLNRCFPGSRRGSLAARLAHLFMHEIVRPSTHGIDLHTGSNQRVNLPQVRADLKDPATLALAQAFGAPVMLDAEPLKGSLREAASKAKVLNLLYEAGEAQRFDQEAIQTGVDGVLRVMVHLGMLASDVVPPPAPSRHLIDSKWVRARCGGIFRPSVRLGQEVRPRECLGVVSDAFGTKEVQVLTSCSGVVIGANLNPRVNQGDALVHVGQPPDAVCVRVEE